MWLDRTRLHTQSEMQKLLAKTVMDMNETLPKTLDTDTILEKTTLAPNLVFTYHYILPHHTIDDFDNKQLLKVKEHMLANGGCKQFHAWIINGVKVIYSYKGADNVLMGDFTITHDDCL